MSKKLGTVAAVGRVLAAAVIFGVVQAAQADDGTVDAKSIVAQAEAIAADVEEQCQLPLRATAEAASADPNALADYEAMDQKCRAIGLQYAYFVDTVEAHADAVTVSIPEEAREAAEAAMKAATPEVKAQMEAGDARGAVRTLFSAIAPQFDIESEVAR